jgi:hypothetical protein
MERNIRQLSRLMKMSWEIQKTKKRTLSKALSAAWAIMSNEDVTIFYLTERYNRKPQKVRVINQMGLFNRDAITNL